MSEETSRKISYSEDDVPLENIFESVGDIVTMLGGTVGERGPSSIAFTLPRRRGVAASGEVAGEVSWTFGESGTGRVTITADEELNVSRPQRLALLVAGVVGAGLFVVWPFFPGLGALAWIGGLVAIAVYLLTLRTTQNGMIWHLLQRIADVQVARAEEGV